MLNERFNHGIHSFIPCQINECAEQSLISPALLGGEVMES